MTLAPSVGADVRTGIPIVPEPVGSGARALGQSAFIAVADDATAASWNPAGLINLERPEASFVGAWKAVTSDPSPAADDLSMDRDSWDASEINFLSYAQPLRIRNANTVLSINYHQVYDFGKEFNYSVQFPEFDDSLTVKGRSEGAVCAYSIAGALSLPSCPQVTVGASFNWYDQGLLNDSVWQVKAESSWKSPPAFTVTETYDDFRGYNSAFGILWDAYEKEENLLTLGFVCHTPFTAKVDQEVVNVGPSVVSDHGRLHIDFPLSYGAGVNYRFSDSLSTAFDVEWVDWSDFKVTYSDGTSDSPIDNDTLALRLGAEHLTFFEGINQSVLACRGGIFYEPRPAPGEPLPVHGLSLGLGWTVKGQFSLDFAYQFRWGEGEEDFAAGLTRVDYRVQEHFFVTSLIKYF